jgi:hypothetical protein
MGNQKSIIFDMQQKQQQQQQTPSNTLTAARTVATVTQNSKLRKLNYKSSM